MADAKRSARRLFVRKHHPDVGGDTDTFREGLAAYDEKTADEKTADEPVPAEEPVAPPRPAGPPVTDKLARGLGRFVAKTAAIPGEVKDAYRDGRDTDNPL